MCVSEREREGERAHLEILEVWPFSLQHKDKTKVSLRGRWYGQQLRDTQMLVIHTLVQVLTHTRSLNSQQLKYESQLMIMMMMDRRAGPGFY